MSGWKMTKHKTSIDKPKRPLSAFNLFVLLESKSILENQLACPTYSIQDVQRVLLEYKFRRKRVHRKSHGKFSFHEFRAFVADRWKKVDKETRKVLENQAALEKEEYQKKVDHWKNSSADSRNGSTAFYIQLQFETVICNLNKKIQKLETFINNQAITSSPDLQCGQKSPTGPNLFYQALDTQGLDASLSKIMPLGWDDTDAVVQHDDCSVIPFNYQDNMIREHGVMAYSQSFDESQHHYFMSAEEMENLFNF